MSTDASRIYYQSSHWKQLRVVRLQLDGYHCTVPGCPCDGSIVDHIEARPDATYPTPLDVIENLRTLCRTHDAQVKERRRNDALSRRNGGVFRIIGCDADGWPLDPERR